MKSDALQEWDDFFFSVFGFSLNTSEVIMSVKPSHECASIVVPKVEMLHQRYLVRSPYDNIHTNMCYRPDIPMVEVYRKALDIFPYTRWTPQPVDMDNNGSYFSDIEDTPNRPQKPYLIWVKIPNFDRNEGRKIAWEERWDTPGPTLLEMMLLDLFWWNKHKTPFGWNRGEDWKTDNWMQISSILCNGSRFKSGCSREKRYNDDPLAKYFGHPDTHLIPQTGWGLGGWYVNAVGYKTATTPSPVPCAVSF